MHIHPPKFFEEKFRRASDTNISIISINSYISIDFMARSLKKGPFIDQNLIEKIKKLKPGTKEIIKTWSRNCTIIPEMVGFAFGVHNGKEFIPVQVTEEMVGHKLGEFSSTTKFSRHGGRIQRELEAQVAEKETEKIKEAKEGEVKK